MKRLPIAALLFAAALPAWNQESEVNVNSRYTVESVELDGVRESKLSRDLREELQRKIGEKYDQQSFEDLRGRIRTELRPRSVVLRLTRGTRPETIRVIYEVTRRQLERLDTSRSKVAYHSKEGWTGDLTVEAGPVILGVTSNNDDLIERFAGLRVGFAKKHLFSDRVQFRFVFEGFHEQWDGATIAALETRSDVPGIYRTRNNLQPEFELLLARGLTLSPGFSFQQIETQFPAARHESSNAVVTTLRLRRRYEDSFSNKHDLDAAYTLHAATRSLDGDFSYTRHTGTARYMFLRGEESLTVDVRAGTMSGRAPLYERFALGNTSTLRGWSKYDVAPLGGDRMAHGSVEYAHKFSGNLAMAFFYDAGSVWDSGASAVARNAAGCGLRVPHDGFYFYVGFPIRSGHVEPLFMAGVNF